MNKTLLISLFLTLLAQNSHAGRDGSPSNCITPGDPACIGTTIVSISCEVQVDGEKSAKMRPCADLKLVVRSERENKIREGELDGSNYRFTGLNKDDSYRVMTTAQDIELLEPKSKIKPGQSIRVRVRQKPLR